MKRIAFTIIGGFMLSFMSAGLSNAQQIQLTSDLPSGQPVGTTITWTVTNNTLNIADYRLSVRRMGEPMRIHYDFSSKNVLTWTPLEDGEYQIVVTARDRSMPSNMMQLPAAFTVTSRATQGPRVSATPNPLVALYSAPLCTAGNRMRVDFIEQSVGPRRATTFKNCDGVHSMNFYVAGMKATTVYILRHEVLDNVGATVEQGPPRSFTTGAIGAGVTIPAITFPIPAGPGVSTQEPFVVISPTPGNGTVPFAIDTDGNTVWYYENTNLLDAEFFMLRMVRGGRFLLVAPSIGDNIIDRFTVREIDMAGNTTRETNARRLSEQFMAAGGQQPIATLHHEARILPNGHTILLGDSKKLVEDVQGPGIVDVIGDVIVALDNNWQVVWQWDSYDHLDITRLALGGETCVSGGPGCPILFLAEEANDWLHSNAVAYSPGDGNLIMSVRNQDWVIKIDYQDGTGDGQVLWHLGDDLGDFDMLSPDPNPWNSAQHDANYFGEDKVLLYDNSIRNPACVADPANCVSRGQLYQLDEVNMTAELLLNVELENFSFALGSAQPMLNGNFSFGSGTRNVPPSSTADEVNPAGDIIFSIGIDVAVYRSFRVPNMYTPPTRSE